MLHCIALHCIAVSAHRCADTISACETEVPSLPHAHSGRVRIALPTVLCCAVNTLCLRWLAAQRLASLALGLGVQREPVGCAHVQCCAASLASYCICHAMPCHIRRCGRAAAAAAKQSCSGPIGVPYPQGHRGTLPSGRTHPGISGISGCACMGATTRWARQVRVCKLSSQQCEGTGA